MEHRTTPSIAVALVLAACGSAEPVAEEPTPPPSPTPTATAAGTDAVILTGGVVHTMDPDGPQASAVRFEGGVITHVIDGEVPEGLTGERVDLANAAVLPGLHDAHLHLRGLGASARQLDLRDTESAEQIAAKVRQAAAEAPEGTWIRGRGWDQNDWEVSELPTHGALDEAAGEHPVWLTRIDGHAVWVNARALELAGIDADTDDPPGGEILRDEDGEPTGVFVDNAIELLEEQLAHGSPEEIRADLERGIEMANRVGLTAVHDMGTTPATLEVLRAMEREGALTLRVFAYLGGDFDALEPLLAEPPDREGLLRVVGVKLYADGALGSRGAALTAPYSDRPDTRGLLVTEPEDLARRATRVHEAGYQLAIHAIGDRGNRVALDAIQEAQGDDRSRGHRIEHAQVVGEQDFRRFANLGVTASMQPTHATSDMPWAEQRVGGGRIRGAYAWKTMQEHEVPLAFGSDAPVERESPWLGIYAAVTRQDPEGQPEGGWYPSQRVSVREAIAGFSRDAARAAGADELGVIRVGAPADLTVVRPDPLSVQPTELDDVETVRTVVAGETVYP